MTNLSVCVLLRVSKKSGKVDTTMTAMGSALMQLWALRNTTPSKMTFIIERDTGKVVFGCSGSKNGFPTVTKEDKLGTCEDLGISFEMLQEIGADDRF